MTTEATRMRVYRRRKHRNTPMSRLRLGAAASGGVVGGGPETFPGIEVLDPQGRGRRWGAGAIAAALHVGFFAIAFLLASLAPEEVIEEIIPVQILHEIPLAAKAPAPAPKALAERRSPVFNPAAQAVAPQVVNPSVVAEAAPAVQADRLQIDSISSSAAPTNISRARVNVQTVQAVTSVSAAAPTRVDVSAVASPALRGPIRAQAPVGPSAGPRQVTTGPSSSIGTGPAVVAEAGSSVRDGVLSNRDVLGSPGGPRLASVNTRVGSGHLRGPGGTGTSLGGVAPDCQERREVQAYMSQIKDRTLSRWMAPPNSPDPSKVTLRFRLDVGGSASSVELVAAADPTVGRSAVDALRSASPFPPMNDRVRCLANTRLVGTFTLSKDSVAN